jgi:hypothetical protein
MVRRFVHFEVLCIAKYRYGEKICHRNGRCFPLKGTPPSANKQLSSHSSRTGKNRRAGPKKFVYIFPLKKQIIGFFWKTFRAFFRPISGLLKCSNDLFNLGWQHCFHRSGTCQCKVSQNVRSGEQYTF